MKIQYSTPRYGEKFDGPSRNKVPSILGYRWANETEAVYHSPVWPRIRVNTKPVGCTDPMTYQDAQGWWVLGLGDEHLAS